MASTTVIESDIVKGAIDKMFGILGNLQGQLAKPQPTSAGTESINTLRCDLAEMTSKYLAKCREYGELNSRYQKLSSCKCQKKPLAPPPPPPPPHKSGGVKNHLSKPQDDGFPDLDEVLNLARQPTRINNNSTTSTKKRTYRDSVSTAGNLLSSTTSGNKGTKSTLLLNSNQQRGAAARKIRSPTKPRRPVTSILGRRFHSPPPLKLTTEPCTKSKPKVPSPPPPPPPAAPEKAAPTVAPLGSVVLDSQDTQLDHKSNDAAESEIILCPSSDVEDEGGGNMKVDNTQLQKQNHKDDAVSKHHKDLQRILEAVGDCQDCREFYSVPGLVLPKRDPTTLCFHGNGRKKRKTVIPTAAAAAAAVTETPPSAKESSNTRGAQSEGPQHRQGRRRPTTPDHFWDIDYFPPIRTDEAIATPSSSSRHKQ